MEIILTWHAIMRHANLPEILQSKKGYSKPQDTIRPQLTDQMTELSENCDPFNFPKSEIIIILNHLGKGSDIILIFCGISTLNRFCSNTDYVGELPLIGATNKLIQNPMD